LLNGWLRRQNAGKPIEYAAELDPRDHG